MIESTQHLGVLTVSLHIPQAGSLKEKRMVLRKIKGRVKNKFNVSVAELDGFDKWQVATLAFAGIDNDNRHLDSCFQKLLSFLESMGDFYICEQQIENY